MKWSVNFLPEAQKDYNALSRHQQIIVSKAIEKVRENPLSQADGGYGKPLGHKRGVNLTNFLKIKLRGEGLRIVYKIIHTETTMLIIIIGVREDEEVYNLAKNRASKHGL